MTPNEGATRYRDLIVTDFNAVLAGTSMQDILVRIFKKKIKRKKV